MLVCLSQMNIETLSSDDILKITAYGHLFPEADEEAIETIYRKLARTWHPDVAVTDKVMTHINVLRDEALRALKGGTWETPGRMYLTDAKGTVYWYNYRTRRPFELGETIVGDDFVVYVVTPDNKDLFINADMTLRRGFKFADKRMRNEFEQYMPRIRESYATNDGRLVINFEKTEDLLLLADVIAHYPEGLPPEHSAWVLSSLFNIACFLQFGAITHNAIATDTIFISPKYHSVALLGGWWYSTRAGSKLIALPKRSANLLPPHMQRGKISDTKLDGELIRAVGRELLKGTSAPDKLKRWLNLPATDNPAAEYMNWKNVLKEVWGPPKFRELKLTSNDIYNIN